MQNLVIWYPLQRSATFVEIMFTEIKRNLVLKMLVNTIYTNGADYR